MDGDLDARLPDGIEPAHIDPASTRSIIWYRVGAIGIVVLAAIWGLVGGGPTPRIARHSPSLSLDLHFPNPIRNGMFVEWRIDVFAREPVEDLVISIPANLWRDMTINTLVPAAEKERSQNGEFLFHFGTLKAGEKFSLKMDGQLNPARTNGQKGTIKVLDGSRLLIAEHVTMDVIF
jgi:hypothetical protein